MTAERSTTSLLPIWQETEGTRLCRMFCRRFGAPKPGQLHGPEALTRKPDQLRLPDGPMLCQSQCKSFAQRKPVKIHRPWGRGRWIATKKAKLK